jgi:hypothetical protein
VELKMSLPSAHLIPPKDERLVPHRAIESVEDADRCSHWSTRSFSRCRAVFVFSVVLGC